jgi:YfiH family protein
VADADLSDAVPSGDPLRSSRPHLGPEQTLPVAAVAVEVSDGWVLSPDGAALRCLEFPAHHAFSTRLGGVSEGLYASLNVGLNSGDDLARVRENRRRFLAAGGFARPWVSVHQVHGPDVVAIGASEIPDAEYGDALISDRPGVPIGVFTADCTPLLLADRSGRAVAAVHAGWRGTVAGIAARAVEALERRFGLAPSDLVAAIGPAAKRCCYEVGEEVVEAFEQIDPTPARDDKESWIAQGPRRSHVDPPVMIRRQLRAAGVPSGQIHASGLCTLCRSDLFFSYRRDGQASGRLVSVLHASM